MKTMAHRRGWKPAAALKPLIVAMACAGVLPALAQSTPGLPQVMTVPSNAGAVDQSIAGDTMTITQTTPRAVANWQSFVIGPGKTVTINQTQGSSSVLLNRVLGGAQSTIDGNLHANGHVYLINPGGIVFGSRARVDVGGIVASTLDVSDDNFMNGGALTFTGTATSASSPVSNAGNITAAGRVALLGGGSSSAVGNNGSITGSTVILAAGQQIVIDPVGDGLTTLRVVAGSQRGATLGNSGRL